MAETRFLRQDQIAILNAFHRFQERRAPIRFAPGIFQDVEILDGADDLSSGSGRQGASRVMRRDQDAVCPGSRGRT